MCSLETYTRHRGIDENLTNARFRKIAPVLYGSDRFRYNTQTHRHVQIRERASQLPSLFALSSIGHPRLQLLHSLASTFTPRLQLLLSLAHKPY